MKLRDLPRVFGIESPPREYPYDIATFQLPGDGEVHLARWLHPGETPKVVTQESVDALRTFLREGDVAIDIGAHTGDSTLPMALAVGSTGCVFALEPNPYVFKVLKANSALNPLKTHIVPLMFAATPADGEFEFEYSDSGYCNGGLHQGIVRRKHSHFYRLAVAGRNLQAYLRTEVPESWSRIRYIKIDTEGLDHTVVQSIEDLVVAVRPYIKAEMYKYLSKEQRRAFYDDLRRLGYRMFKCENDCVYRGPELGPNDLSRWQQFDVFAVPE